MQNASSIVLGLAFALLVTWLGQFFIIQLVLFLDCTGYPFLKRLLQLSFFWAYAHVQKLF
eukprot:8638370-Ditylum_brightwellii.AAC.1